MIFKKIKSTAITLGAIVLTITPIATTISCGSKHNSKKREYSYDIDWKVEAGKYHGESTGSFHIEKGTSYVMPVIFRGSIKRISMDIGSAGSVTYEPISFIPTLKEVLEDGSSSWSYDTHNNEHWVKIPFQPAGGISSYGSGVDKIVAIYTVTKI